MELLKRPRRSETISQPLTGRPEPHPQSTPPEHTGELLPQDPDLREAFTQLPTPRFEYLANPQEDAFARNTATAPSYLEAYTQAGYPAPSHSKAHRLAGTPRLQERIAYYQNLQAQRLDVRADRITAEIAALAFVDITEAFDHSDRLLPIHQIPKHHTRAIQAIDTHTRTRILESGEEIVTTHTKLKYHDKYKALDLLSRIKGMTAPDASTPKIEINIK